ncbi:tyrosine-protein phosphatase non-receptor type 23 [Sceloporus undulatus]|uniref:tyrosine-protein phosphatase non-receptor type 23 n=1 Tax=Sceloporus undulatus TaxID=8520 RepID=UPI001C4DAC00|nr:tyrosine-protein phosphatase non-receptor type 23 [Sceloporus undulatus]
MEAVPRMPMIWLDLKEAGDFGFHQAVKKFVLKNYGENPENYNEELKKLEQLRQNAVNVPRDFEGCSILRKYFGQLHYLQSRIPMGAEHEAAVPITWTEIFSGKAVTHEDIKYEQACILYNLGALHSMLGAMDKRVSEEGMKVSCTHFQCAAGAFTYLRDHFPHSYSVDMSHQILNLNINLMLGQAQECLLEKSMLDNRKSFLVARISAQVVDYYKEACRALENSETASLLGKIQKDWKKLVQMKIYYFAAVAHLHMGKQAEEQQKYGERVIYFQSALDKLNEAIKLAKGQPETVQEALRFTMDVIGGKYNSAKKDNDFIYHEAVPALDTLQSVKGAPLVKALPVNPTDPAVTGPDIFAKLVPMAAHEASSLYSEEKAKLLREVMAKIDAKNEVLEQFMDSLQLDPETVDNLDMYNHIPPVLMEKCAALSVRPETVKNLVQSMQVLSGVFTDVEASLREIKDLLDEDEVQEQKLRETLGKPPLQQESPPTPSSGLAEVAKEWAKYMEVHEKASFTNTELHKAMNLHISNLRLLSGPLEQVRAALPTPSLTEEDKQVMQNLKRILSKVQEMKDQRISLEQQLREMIQKDDITTSLVTTDRSEMKKLFEEQLKKYDQIKVYLDQNLAAQENVLKALTDANVKYAAVRKILAEVEHKWNTTLQTLVASYEAYEDLMKKSQEGKDFYADLESKVAKLLEKTRAACKAAEITRQQVLAKEMKLRPPPRPTTPKPALQKKPSELEGTEMPALASLSLADLPEELRSLPPEVLAAHLAQLPCDALAALGLDPAFARTSLRGPGPEAFGAVGGVVATPLQPARASQPGAPFSPGHFVNAGPMPGHYQPTRVPASSGQGHFPGVPLPTPLTSHQMPPSIPRTGLPPLSSAPSSVPSPQVYPTGPLAQGPPLAPVQPAYPRPPLPSQQTSPQHIPMSISAPGGGYSMGQPVPSNAVGPAGHPTPLTVRPTVLASHHFSTHNFPSHTQVVRPATTTVDSIQGPISSCTAPRGVTGPVPQWTGPPPPQGGFVGPQGPSIQFPYTQATGPPFMPPVLAPYSTAQPQPGFPPHRHLQPTLDRQIRPRAVGGQVPPPQYPPQFLPQAQAPQQTLFQGPYPPQVSGQQAVLSQVPVHPASQGQLPSQMAQPQHYQLPAPDKMPPRVVPPHSGALGFPTQVPRGSNITVGMMGPGQPLPLCPSHAAIQPLPPGSASQGPFGSVPPVTTQIPPGAPVGLVGPQPPPPSNQSVPRHVPPAPSPALAQMPGGVVVQGAALPSPAPSPQPPMALQAPSVPCSGPLPQLPPSSLGPGAASLLQGPSEVQFHRQSSSTDDLLSSSPESQHGGAKTAVGQPLLQPTKADAKDGLKPKAVQLIENDPYEKPERLRRLLSELERFQEVVACLGRPSPSGTGSELDSLWKALQDAQEKDARQLSIAIARCYSMKNRHQDIMPYDKNRIVLQSGKDDYINASKIEDLSSYCPTIIATQAPLVGTASDFWLMIYEQKVSVVVMLVSEQEIEKQKVVRYFPTERGQPMVHGPITLVLTSLKITPTHTERMISLQFRDQSLKRTIIHLQFSSWPELGLPDSKGDLLRFIQEVHSHYLHQRPLHMPIVVHCSSGVGRSGAFCLLYAAMQEVEAGNSIPDLAQLVKRIRQQRKHMLQEKLHLKFCYESVLKHAKQVLQRHGVLSVSAGKPSSSTLTSTQKLYVHQDPQDLVLGGDMPISSIQATIAKLSIRPPSGGAEPPTNGQQLLEPPPLTATASVSVVPAPPAPPPQLAVPDHQVPGATEPPPPLSPPAEAVGGPSPAENSNHVEEEKEGEGDEKDQQLALPGPEPPTSTALAMAPSSSSLELLASLTPEAFTLDNSLKGRHRMNKQSFLQPQNGEGLRGARPSDDPLSMLDPLWTLNKT